MVCSDDKSVFDFPAKPATTACEHLSNTCHECMQTWIGSELDAKGWDRIPCPECNAVLEYAAIKTLASPETFARFDRLSARAAVGQMENFVWCIGPNCGSGQEHAAGIAAPIFVCAICRFRQCIVHKMAWHDNETCKEYDYRTTGQKKKDEEKASEDVVNKSSVMCPGHKCGARIEKSVGCDHMTCRKCRTEFCYMCQCLYTEIRRLGNTAHKTTCPYHSNNIRYPH
ncbi:hypothetical protein K402DRAFT_340717 [Aulographum hederae CBS 113979]|uniref:RBR-type E3 ubiquitin transferase n=1 Tax=Aulographum hederae CBS 113979 TaxID=1176131 RepID=A0A6G1GNF8_9PEZI|nr:hypothetical protein K402DRAFT_340717 [Aulographum hederae CBS 113979]